MKYIGKNTAQYIAVASQKGKKDVLEFGSDEKTFVYDVGQTQSRSLMKKPLSISIRDNAEVHYIFLLPDGISVDYDSERIIRVGKNSQLYTYFFYFGGMSNTIKNTFSLDTKARVCHSLVYWAHNNQKYFFQEDYGLRSPGSYGRFVVKGLTSQDAQSDFQGKIHIYPHAQKSDSYLDMESHILGGQARSSVVPSLQIEANDVRAGHSAKISKIDDEQLFYMRSRGFTPHDALQMFVEKIFVGSLHSIPHESITSEILTMAQRVMRAAI